MKTLALTTPHMTGRAVTEAQRKLSRPGWLEGNVDGEFGPDTARACKRAKYWLGYPESRLTGTYGDVLDKLLTHFVGSGELPASAPLYRTRRAARLRRARETPLRLKALSYMKTKVGQKEEPPNSNRVKWASEWYGLIGPWCAMAVTRAYVEAGSKAFARGTRYAYCPFIYADAVAGRNHLAITYNPQPGDLVLFDWQRDGVADHIGLLDRLDNNGPRFWTVEGNTARGNDSDGGQVMQRTRAKSQVQAFVHVGA